MSPGGAKRSATIYDVAKRAGVSHQTVARFLNGDGGIRPYNRVKVEAALEELQYRPNMVARLLATNRTYRLGALGFEIAGHNPGLVLQGASDAARELGYIVEVMGLDPLDPGMLAGGVEELVRKGAEGLLITSPTVGTAAALAELDIEVPIVIVGGDGAAASERRGARLVLDHLTDLGHTQVAHLAGPPEWTAAQFRLTEYERWAGEVGTVPVVWPGDWDFESGYRRAEMLPGSGVTAVFAANDRIAMGALLRMHELGIRVPEDVSVVGFDDLSMSGYTYPPLTTVRMEFERSGRVSVARLIAAIEGREHAGDYPEHRLVVRRSSGPVRA
ncbi:LacI family DNA-binding transcriptional regulator [Ruania alkalisoli]|uniref:LacI family DNA-binding transcriptional regulator n=1 Tax=Ruania alkalisoli TaxID=2779775 RepID=A0A7M1SYX4_9MICO|nr:LacI family DNA-binding transcriptional regulator [Ruania alkalisoli]QOR71833.1 LacI family DNA-binding transcriptional regulator [Ruania alkalisoli]